MRAETGTMRFGDDWTGVFIRGDRAVWLGLLLQGARLEQPVDEFTQMQLDQLAALLQSADERAGDEPDQQMYEFDSCADHVSEPKKVKLVPYEGEVEVL